MAIEDEETYPKFLRGLSAGLAAAAAANAEMLLPSGADKEMKKLSESIQQIALSLEDAKARSERKSTSSAAWFRELKGIVYEIDGIMQSFSPRGSDHGELTGRRANPKSAMQLKAIGSTLNKIMKKQNFAGHHHDEDDKMIAKMSIRNCPLEPTILLGKNDDQDQEKIVALLLSAKQEAGPSIVAIDRKGGAGGTTELARSVFDDKRVQNHFRRRVWVDAADIVDAGKLSELITKPASTVFWVHRTMDLNSEEEEVLLVLDDVRNKRYVELRGSWIRDDSVLTRRPCMIEKHTGTKRKVVVSTKQRRIWEADAVDETPKRLSAEESWAVFKERALGSGRRPELEAVGRDIVGSVGWSRRMISEMGSILSANMETRYWKMMLQSQVWKLPVDEENSQPLLAKYCHHPDPPGILHGIHYVCPFTSLKVMEVEEERLTYQCSPLTTTTSNLQGPPAMAIDDEETYPKFLRGLSAGLAAAAAANAEMLLPSGADKEMKKLSESIQWIARSLEEAKARSERKSTASAAWFRELKGIVYEIDGILQSFSHCFLAYDQLPSRRANPKTAMQLKAIGSRLNKIMKKQNFSGHHHATDNKTTARMSIRNCPLEPITLLGKNDDQDQEKIVALLLSAKQEAGPSIVAIDRKGGAGGTTELARSVFDDKRVQNHFTRRVWVDASEIVDAGKLSELISRPASTVFWVHRTMDLDSEEQEVLLVLDDVRNKKRVELRGSWIRDDGGQKGPWVITNSTETKRKVVISTAKELNWDPFYQAGAGYEAPPSRKAKAKRLSSEESWAIFKEAAFGSGKRPELEAIGRDIVGNFGKNRPPGFEAVISKIGEILSANLETRYWKMILESQVWKLPVDEEISQPTLAELCYHPSMPPCQYWKERYCGGGKPEVHRMITWFWKRSRALV